MEKLYYRIYNFLKYGDLNEAINELHYNKSVIKILQYNRAAFYDYLSFLKLGDIIITPFYNEINKIIDIKNWMQKLDRQYL